MQTGLDCLKGDFFGKGVELGRCVVLDRNTMAETDHLGVEISDFLNRAAVQIHIDGKRIRWKAQIRGVKHDVSVRISSLPEYVDTALDELNALAPYRLSLFGHIGDGNLHYSACEPKDAAQPVLGNVAAQITEIVHAQAMAFGGSISAEHGVGRLKRDELADIRSPAATAAMIAIKKALDPDGIMNPGRVVPAD